MSVGVAEGRAKTGLEPVLLTVSLAGPEGVREGLCESVGLAVSVGLAREDGESLSEPESPGVAEGVGESVGETGTSVFQGHFP